MWPVSQFAPQELFQVPVNHARAWISATILCSCFKASTIQEGYSIVLRGLKIGSRIDQTSSTHGYP